MGVKNKNSVPVSAPGNNQCTLVNEQTDQIKRRGESITVREGLGVFLCFFFLKGKKYLL